MYSLSKTRINLETARQIVSSCLGSSYQLVECQELTEGYFNAAYDLLLKDGLRCVLKIAPPPEVRILRYEQGILNTEVEVLRQVKSRTGIPAPQVLAYDPSCQILPSSYFIMEFLPGVPYHKLRKDLPAEINERIDYQVGEYLRQLNNIAGSAFGYPGWKAGLVPTMQAAFDHMLSDILQDGQELGVELPLSYPELQRRMRSVYACLDEVCSPCLVHWDLWDGNIFINPQSHEISAIIDFERALWAEALMEVNFGVFGDRPAFIQGYSSGHPEEHLLASPQQRCRRTLYNLYLFLIMIIECTPRQYDNHDQENYARLRLDQELKLLEGFEGTIAF